MPHECTNCGRAFPDGSKEMLSGCPECGGNKFRYRPAGGRLDGSSLDGDDRPESPADSPTASGGDDPPGLRDRSSTSRVGDAASTLRDLVGRSGGADSPPGSVGGSDPPATDATEGDGNGPAGEDAAQASARSSVVDPDDLPGGAPVDGGSGSTGDPERTDASGSPDRAGQGPTGSGSAAGAVPGSSESSTRGDVDGDGGDAPADSNLAELRRELNDQFESIKIVEPGQYELNLMELYDRDEYIISLKEDGRYVIEVPETWRGDA